MNRRTFLEMALAGPVLGGAMRRLDQGRATAPAGAPPPAREVPWTQWGGPHRNFTTEASGIRDPWPASGPRVLWKRPLGEGYSSIDVEHDRLYTMYGRRGQETVVAAHVETGATFWEYTAPMTFRSDAAQEQGNGPYATPLIAGSRRYTTSVAGRLICLDKLTGRMLWTCWSTAGSLTRDPPPSCRADRAGTAACRRGSAASRRGW